MNFNENIIVGMSGGLYSSISAIILKDMGFKDIVLLEGGTEAWKKSGYALEKK